MPASPTKGLLESNAVVKGLVRGCHFELGNLYRRRKINKLGREKEKMNKLAWDHYQKAISYGHRDAHQALKRLIGEGENKRFPVAPPPWTFFLETPV